MQSHGFNATMAHITITHRRVIGGGHTIYTVYKNGSVIDEQRFPGEPTIIRHHELMEKHGVDKYTTLNYGK
jgi:hypothetical protein